MRLVMTPVEHRNAPVGKRRFRTRGESWLSTRSGVYGFGWKSLGSVVSGFVARGAYLCGRLHATIDHDLLNRIQPCFDARHLSAMLSSAFGGLLGDQPAHSLLVLEPPPKP